MLLVKESWTNLELFFNFVTPKIKALLYFGKFLSKITFNT